MRILVSNDDGIYSPGLRLLARAASSFGDVRIVAPDVEQSSTAHAITASKPLWYRRAPMLRDFEAYRVNGTPADCVALGAYNWDRVDLVLSGVNLGTNLGNALWHSGTLAAAKQAALLKIRGIAFSAPITEETDLARLEPHVCRVLETLLPETDLPLVNVNLPLDPIGIRWTSQAVAHYDGRVVPGEDPMGRRHFWFTVKRIEEADASTDLGAMERGYISMTPLRLDLTDHVELARLVRERPLDHVGSALRRGRVPESSEDEEAEDGEAPA